MCEEAHCASIPVNDVACVTEAPLCSNAFDAPYMSAPFLLVYAVVTQKARAHSSQAPAILPIPADSLIIIILSYKAYNSMGSRYNLQLCDAAGLGRAVQQHRSDVTDRLGWVEALRADIDAILDAMASENTEGII